MKHAQRHKLFSRMQRSLLPFLLGTALTGCVGPGVDLSSPGYLPSGYYMLDMRIYKSGLAEVSPVPRGVRVQMLETFKGSFELHSRGGNELVIRRESIDYPGVRRSLDGTGTLTAPGHVSGEAVSWVKKVVTLSNDHRKGPWTLRPATPEEVERWRSKEEKRERNHQRAKDLLDGPG